MPDQKEIMAYDGQRTCITQYDYPLQNLIFFFMELIRFRIYSGTIYSLVLWLYDENGLFFCL